MSPSASLGFQYRQLVACARRFLAEESGASLPLTAAVLIPLMGFIGLGTDAARGYLVKARLGDALDAAVLAGAHVIDLADLQSEIQKYFDANFPPGYMGATVTLYPASLSGADDEIINISAKAAMSTTFMRLFGFNTLDIGSATEVTRQTISMDVALSMDLSGSMGWSDGSGGTRIAAARTASHTLVDILYGNNTTNKQLLIGLVPWNGAVNVWLNGTVYDRTMVTTEPEIGFINPWTGSPQSETYLAANSPVPLLRKPPSNWNGCVYARYLDNATNDDDADHLLGPLSTVDNTEWLGWMDSGDRYSRCLDHGITPLTSDRSTIDNAIDDLLNPEGVTDIAQGLAWAWRVVSPGVPFDEADPFPKGLHDRAIVLLTDGEQWGGSNDGYNAVFGTGTAAGPNGMNDRLLAVAANAKAEGIKIYVIQFFYNSGPLQALLQQVATEPGPPYYHFAPDGAALNGVFKEIATDLSALRISK